VGIEENGMKCGTRIRRGGTLTLLAVALVVPRAVAQEPEPTTRTEAIEAAKKEKSAHLEPYKPNRAEYWVDKAEDILTTGINWHPFFENAYSGGGFTLGAGYLKHVGSYNLFDVRGSITFTGYKRIETQFLAPRVFNRRGVFSVIAGWREATQVGFYGIGTGNTSSDDRANYSFKQPWVGATLDVRPARRVLLFGAGVELSQWQTGTGSGSAPSIEEVYTPATLPGLGAKPTYVHSQGTVALDWRGPSAGYSRRGGYYAVTAHDYEDNDSHFGFNQVDYDALQHIPLLREAWVLSLHGHVETTSTKSGQVIPYFMLPALGGGSSLRGFSSWRFRDRNSMLLQAEWRVMVNRFVDTAIFYDAGKVVARQSDLDFDGLKKDYGLGFRFHGPVATPLRIDFAKSNEGLSIVFSSAAAF
jgi:hypothetical protein